MPRLHRSRGGRGEREGERGKDGGKFAAAVPVYVSLCGKVAIMCLCLCLSVSVSLSGKRCGKWRSPVELVFDVGVVVLQGRGRRLHIAQRLGQRALVRLDVGLLVRHDKNLGAGGGEGEENVVVKMMMMIEEEEEEEDQQENENDKHTNEEDESTGTNTYE